MDTGTLAEVATPAPAVFDTCSSRVANVSTTLEVLGTASLTVVVSFMALQTLVAFRKRSVNGIRPWVSYVVLAVLAILGLHSIFKWLELPVRLSCDDAADKGLRAVVNVLEYLAFPPAVALCQFYLIAAFSKRENSFAVKIGHWLIRILAGVAMLGAIGLGIWRTIVSELHYYYLVAVFFQMFLSVLSAFVSCMAFITIRRNINVMPTVALDLAKNSWIAAIMFFLSTLYLFANLFFINLSTANELLQLCALLAVNLAVGLMQFDGVEQPPAYNWQMSNGSAPVDEKRGPRPSLQINTDFKPAQQTYFHGPVASSPDGPSPAEIERPPVATIPRTRLSMLPAPTSNSSITVAPNAAALVRPSTPSGPAPSRSGRTTPPNNRHSVVSFSVPQPEGRASAEGEQAPATRISANANATKLARRKSATEPRSKIGSQISLDIRPISRSPSPTNMMYGVPTTGGAEVPAAQQLTNANNAPANRPKRMSTYLSYPTVDF